MELSMKTIPCIIKRCYSCVCRHLKSKLFLVLILFPLICGYLKSEDSAVQQDVPMSQSSPPASVACIPPWETLQAVIVSIPLESMLESPKLLDLYTNIAAVVTKYCDLLVCYSFEERGSLPTLMDHFQSDERVRQNTYRIDYVEAETSSLWIRDYGPVFGKNSDGTYTIFQNRYEIKKSKIDALEKKDPRMLDDYEKELLNQHRMKQVAREEDSRTNAHLAQMLGYLYGMEASIKKTGLLIEGGDFMYAGNERLITSETGFLDDDVEKSEFTGRLKTTYGVNHVYYLPNLPGNAATHLDMNMMILDEGHILLNEVPQRNKEKRIYMDYLYSLIEKQLSYSQKYLKKQLPDMKILMLPSLPIIADSRKTIVNKLWNRVFDRAGAEIGIEWVNVLQWNKDHKQRIAAEKMIKDEIIRKVGPVDFWEEEGLGRTLRYYFGTTLEREDWIHSERLTFYRSYTNCLFIKSPSGEEAILLPRYPAMNPDEEKMIAEFEPRVEAAYHEARPDATIYWLDVEPLIGLQGVIHCLTSTVPYDPDQVSHNE